MAYITYVYVCVYIFSFHLKLHYISHSFLIHSSILEHLGYLPTLAIVNSSALFVDYSTVFTDDC
jgi:hypothetical protein